MLGISAGTAAVVCGAFSATMTIGRLLADRVVEWLGSETVLRYGASRPRTR
ncbi:MFS transporter [Kocuria marina]|uniref:MFS transporter n=1 Tax=Kocuria marina TaxID=223184 RepID=UPI0011A0A5E2|nr:MFS transporter [Kocuria indica]